MATGLAGRIASIASGKRRVRPLPTLAIALVVTAAVAIPLTEVVANSNAPGADPNSIVVDLLDADPQPLDGAVLAGDALVSLNDAEALGASFQLFASGTDAPLLSSQDLTGPNFFPLESADGSGQPLDTTMLPNGQYELFVTIAKPAGDQRTAVLFEVSNS